MAVFYLNQVSVNNLAAIKLLVGLSSSGVVLPTSEHQDQLVWEHESQHPATVASCRPSLILQGVSTMLITRLREGQSKGLWALRSSRRYRIESRREHGSAGLVAFMFRTRCFQFRRELTTNLGNLTRELILLRPEILSRRAAEWK
jgi:hypothetical protein